VAGDTWNRIDIHIVIYYHLPPPTGLCRDQWRTSRAEIEENLLVAYINSMRGLFRFPNCLSDPRRAELYHSYQCRLNYTPLSQFCFFQFFVYMNLMLSVICVGVGINAWKVISGLSGDTIRLLHISHSYMLVVN
jgi:hypothetical protein